jgi:hypothetical protein
MVVTSLRDRCLFIKPEAEAVFSAVGTARSQTDFNHVAEVLHEIALNFIAGYRRRVAARAGERAHWLRRIESLAQELLSALGVEKPGAPPNYQGIEALLNEGPTNDAHSIYLRRALTESIGGHESPGEWEAAHAAVRGLQFLMLRAGLAASQAESEKGAKRTAPREEINFVAALEQYPISLDHTRLR